MARDERSDARPRILAVDDEPQANKLVARSLRAMGHVETAASGDAAWKLAERNDFDLVISDQRMPGMSGVELLTRIARKNLETGRILITAYADIADTITAINEGRVHAYLGKPCDPEQLQATAASVLELVGRSRLAPQTLLGVSGAMRETMDRVRQVAPTRLPVLILGETGVGKELVARAVHDQSPRSGRPFVALNCGALPEALLESELFGFRKGAFTGADRDKPGLFETADGGTLFLDEIGDMPRSIQVKLLRTLETQEVRPLGGNATKRVDVRLVSATHRDLEAEVKEGDFREDLYYRINTMILQVVPLRARRVDIPILAQHFAEEFARGQRCNVTLRDDFLEALGRLDYPGNVRELRNRVERAIAMAGMDGAVTADHLDGAAARSFPRPEGGTLRALVDQVETQAIQEAMGRLGGNRTRVARELGLSRQGLRKKMVRLGLEDGPDR